MSEHLILGNVEGIIIMLLGTGGQMMPDGEAMGFLNSTSLVSAPILIFRQQLRLFKKTFGSIILMLHN
ncbi:MAG: hypothetical protein AB7H48_07960 [Parachlamydiales bacterium]